MELRGILCLLSNKMKIMKVNYNLEVPDNFTGITEFLNGSKRWYKDGKYHRIDGPAIEFANGTKEWYKEGKYHRLDGPAIEWSDGGKAWYLEDENYRQVNLKDYVILDSYRGRYGIMWYKLLGVDKIIEYPNIPGLIEK
jgi:hypothetical protein